MLAGLERLDDQRRVATVASPDHYRLNLRIGDHRRGVRGDATKRAVASRGRR